MTFITRHPALDGEHCASITQKRADLPSKVVERIFMFCEDNEFLAAPVRGEHVAIVLQKTRKFFPFTILAAHAHVVRFALKQTQRSDFRLQLDRS